MLNYYK